MFTPSNLLQKYLETRPRDMYDVVGALIGYINADPGFWTNDFEEAIKYVLNHGVSEAELYKDFDPGCDFEEDESRWDDEYYSYARVYLKDNFCRKRIEHVKKVAKKVYPKVTSDAPDKKLAPKRNYKDTSFCKNHMSIDYRCRAGLVDCTFYKIGKSADGDKIGYCVLQNDKNKKRSDRTAEIAGQLTERVKAIAQYPHNKRRD